MNNLEVVPGEPKKRDFDTHQTDTMRHAGNTPYRLLDAWRGAAALWVVMLHVRLDSTPDWLRHISEGGLLGVPMFFVISGYCIANAAVRALHAPSPVGHFLKARVRRIYPPYLLASGLAATLSLLLTVLVERHVVGSSQIAELNLWHQGWRFWVGTLTLTQLPLHTTLMIRVFWSLCYEVAFYGLAALLLLTAWKTKRPDLLLNGMALLTLGVLAWLCISPRSCPFPWNLWPQFGLGALAYQVLALPGRKAPRLIFAACAALAITHGARDGAFAAPNVAGSGLRMVFSLGFACLLLLLFRWDTALARLRPVRALAWVGLFSYSLYLIHLLALGVVTQGLSRLGPLQSFGQSSGLLLYALKLALCVAAGWLFFQIGERPFLDTRQKQVRQEAQHERS